MASSSFNPVHILIYHIGTIAADTDAQLPIVSTDETWKIKRIYILDDAGVSKDSTNYTTISVMNSTNTVASKSTKDLAITVNSPYELTISNDKISAGDVLEFKKADEGSGQALTNAVLVIEYYLGYP